MIALQQGQKEALFVEAIVETLRSSAIIVQASGCTDEARQTIVADFLATLNARYTELLIAKYLPVGTTPARVGELMDTAQVIYRNYESMIRSWCDANPMSKEALLDEVQSVLA